MTSVLESSKTQQEISKYFFYLLTFSLVFVIVLYNLIGFQYLDETCVILLFVLFFFAVLKTPKWEFNKVFLFTLGVFFFYTVYSILIGSNSKRAIFNDLIITLKPFLGFFCVYHLKPYFDKSRKKLLKDVSLLIWCVILLPVGISSMVYSGVMRLILSHPAYFGIATTIVSCCYLYCCDFTKRNKIIFFIILSIGLFSGKSKFYGFFILSLFLIFFFDNVRHFKFNLKNVLIISAMLAVIVLVAWQKISLYFYQAMTGSGSIDQDMIARFVLYDTFPKILKDYFPFGSGFASYGTYSSGIYYSHIYQEYGINQVWGISKGYSGFISDTYYPSLAQFGIAGIILFILFWAFIIKKALSFYKTSGRMLQKHLILILLMIGFLIIESTTGSTFIAQGGFFVMMMLGLVLSEMRRGSFAITNNQNL